VTRNALAALIAPRTFRIVGGGASLRKSIARGGRCAERRGGEVDVVFVKSGRAPTPRSTLVLCGKKLNDSVAAPITIGRGGGIWTPTLSLGLTCSRRRKRGEASLLLISQGRAVAQQILDLAATTDLPLVGALALGSAPATTWTSLLPLVRELDPRPTLLLALHRQPTLDELVEAASNADDTLLLLPCPRGIVGEQEFPPAAIAPALGWPTFETAAALVEAAALNRAGSLSKRRSIYLLASSADEAALLEVHRQRVELATKSPPRLWRDAKRCGGTSILESLPLAPKHALVLAGQSFGASDGGAVLSIGPARGRRLGVFFEALAGLRRAAPPESAQKHQRSSTAANKASFGLRRPQDAMGELEVRGFFEANSLPVSRLVLTRSASAAGDAARQLGLPVELRLRLRQGAAPTLSLSANSAAGARQAFRDLINQYAETERPPVIDGVIVTPARTRAAELDAHFLRLRGVTLLRLALSRGSDRPLFVTLPLSSQKAARLTRELFANAAAGGGETRAIGGVVARIARAFHRDVSLDWLRVSLALDSQLGARLLVGSGARAA